MFIRRSALILAALALVGCPEKKTSTTSGSAEAATSAPETTEPASPTAKEGMTLKFDWSTVGSADVTAKRERTTLRTDVEGPRVRKSEASWTWNVAADGGASAVNVADYARVITEQGSAPEQMVDFSPAMDVLAEAAPSMRIGADGSVLAITDGERIRTDLDAAMDGIEGLEDGARARLGALASDDGLFGLSQNLWNVIGQWDGVELVQGETVRAELPTPIPQLGGAVLTMVLETTWTKRAPCGEHTRDLACIQVDMKSFIDPEELGALLEQLMGNLADGQGSPQRPKVLDIGLDTNVTLVTTPGTLVPRRAGMKRIITLEVDEGEGPKKAVQTEDWSWTFAWTR